MIFVFLFYTPFKYLQRKPDLLTKVFRWGYFEYMEIEELLIDRVTEYIKKYANGRKPVFWGYVPDVYEAIKAAGHSPEAIFSIMAKDDPILFTPREMLNGKADSFYVIVPDHYHDADSILKKYGFTKDKDYVFYREYKTYDGKIDLKDEFENDINISANVHCNIKGGVRNKVSVSCSTKNLTIDIIGSDNIVEITDCRFAGENSRIYIGKRCGLTIESDCRFHDPFFRLWEDSVISIDKKTTGEKDLQIVADPSSFVTVGRDCMFSEQVLVSSCDGHAIFDCETGKPVNIDELGNAGSVIIGAHVWVGRRATVLGGIKGTELGNGMIAGAGAVVKGKFPNNTAIGGNPAHIIRKNVAWSRNFLYSRGIEDCGGYAEMTENND